ncbi:MAG: hypothetical protein V4638_00355 [Bacteroidota bacterium]
MKKQTSIFLVLLVTLITSACTLLVAKNVPGKKQKTIPKTFCGSYVIVTGNEIYSFLDDAQIEVKITEEGIETNDPEKGPSFSKLGDSLYWSKVGKDAYLSMGEGKFSVYKMVKSGSDIIMSPVAAKEGTTKEQLQKYFKDVELEGEVNEMTGESYLVTIDDKKLKSFFKSDIFTGDEFKLVAKKN